MKIDYELIETYCKEANKALRDMHQEGILHDPRKTDHVKCLFSIMQKGKCLMDDEGMSGYSGGRWDPEAAYGRGGSYRGYSRDDGYPMSKTERERATRYGEEMGRW